MVRLWNLANWCFVVGAISLSHVPPIEASAQINISLEVDNPLKVLVNTSVAYLRWNYTFAGDEEFKEADFYFGNDYIGYIDTQDLVLSRKFKDRFDLERPGTLIIHNVAASDTGMYTFEVKTREATKAGSTVYLDVLVPPAIDSAPSAYQVIEGNGAILFCNATGNPQPNITWTKQGHNSKLSTSETLNLTKLTREDDGSVYKCTVTNEVGSAEATITVTVFCKCR